EIEVHFALRERAAQVGPQHQAARVVWIVLRTVQRVAVAGTLCYVHRNIGAPQERLGGGAVLRRDRDPDAGGHLERVAVDDERPLDTQQRVGDLHGTVGVGVR